MDDNSGIILKVLKRLNKGSDRTKIEQGDFKNAPNLQGYLLNLYDIVEFPLFLIINNSKDYEITEPIKNINDITFILINNGEDVTSIIELLDKVLSKDVTIKSDSSNKEDYYTKDLESRLNLPHGYYKDKEGNVKIDKEEANDVRNIFTLYVKLKSMRKVSALLLSSGKRTRTGLEYGVGIISGILHNSLYRTLKPTIIPPTLIKQAYTVLTRNRSTKSKQEYSSLGHRLN